MSYTGDDTSLKCVYSTYNVHCTNLTFIAFSNAQKYPLKCIHETYKNNSDADPINKLSIVIQLNCMRHKPIK